jgi:hypothetical protein
LQTKHDSISTVFAWDDVSGSGIHRIADRGVSSTSLVDDTDHLDIGSGAIVGMVGVGIWGQRAHRCPMGCLGFLGPEIQATVIPEEPKKEYTSRYLHFS